MTNPGIHCTVTTHNWFFIRLRTISSDRWTNFCFAYNILRYLHNNIGFYVYLLACKISVIDKSIEQLAIHFDIESLCIDINAYLEVLRLNNIYIKSVSVELHTLNEKNKNNFKCTNRVFTGFRFILMFYYKL